MSLGLARSLVSRCAWSRLPYLQHQSKVEMNVQQSMMTEALRRWRIIPVIVIDEPKNAVPLATALLAGGLPIAEITLRTPAALDVLRRITQELPEMFAGVGTVLNVRQAD